MCRPLAGPRMPGRNLVDRPGIETSIVRCGRRLHKMLLETEGILVVFSETRNEIRSAGRILSGAIKRQVFDSISLLFLSTLEDG